MDESYIRYIMGLISEWQSKRAEVEKDWEVAKNAKEKAEKSKKDY